MATLAGAHVAADRPISAVAEDRLGRGRLAEAIAEQARHAPSGHGFVIAVAGPWGSGKTSVLNMIDESLRGSGDVLVVRFNPWFFSGAEDLLSRFFDELAAAFNRRGGALKAAADRVKDYGRALIPISKLLAVLGLPGAGVDEILQALGAARSTSVQEQHDELASRLAKVTTRVVVMIDDLDRLTEDEIRDVLRLVKLVGDFPNVTYLLAFDRTRVAVNELGGDGRGYLEKIVQAIHDIPAVAPESLTTMLLVATSTALGKHDEGTPPEDWPGVFQHVIRPLFANVRDIRRFVNAIPVAMHMIGEDVAVTDVLALEAIRVFLPDVHALLPDSVRALTRERGDGELFLDGKEREAEDRASIERLLAAGRERHEIVKQMCLRMFPASGKYVGGMTYETGLVTWRKERRVADPDVLRTYLSKRVPDDAVDTNTVREALAAAGDRDALRAIFARLRPDQAEDLIERIGDHAGEMDAAAVPVFCSVLLERYACLRTEQRHFLDFGPEPLLYRAVYFAVEPLPGPERDRVLADLFANAPNLSGRFRLVKRFGDHADADRPNADRLMGRELTDRLRDDLLDRLAAADIDELLAERDLPRLLGTMYHDDGDRGHAALRALAERPEGMERLLFTFRDGDLSDRANWTRLADLLGTSFADRARAATRHSEALDVTDIESFLDRRDRA